MLFQSFFDPGHGLLSSFDERAVAATAFGFLAAVGLLAARLDVPSTPAVCSGLVAFVVGVVALAPPSTRTSGTTRSSPPSRSCWPATAGGGGPTRPPTRLSTGPGPPGDSVTPPGYDVENPPSTTSPWPVTHDDSSLARKTMGSAISSASPSRRRS